MANKSCRHAIALGVVLASLGAETAEARDKVTVRVRVENAAGVSGSVVLGAQSDASRIYSDAGIDIVWVNRDDRECCDGGRTIRVVLPSLKNTDQYLRLEHINKQALADANAAASMVHIFWDRLAMSASRHGRDEAGLLGVVLAHEIGHVLLPGAGHSTTGIMQASVELRMLAPLRFTMEQSEAMRSRLRQEPDLPVAGTQAITIR